MANVGKWSDAKGEEMNSCGIILVEPEDVNLNGQMCQPECKILTSESEQLARSLARKFRNPSSRSLARVKNQSDQLALARSRKNRSSLAGLARSPDLLARPTSSLAAKARSLHVISKFLLHVSRLLIYYQN
jgi:hypothetical protein